LNTTNAGDQPVREREIEMENDKTENSAGSYGYAARLQSAIEKLSERQEIIFRREVDDESGETFLSMVLIVNGRCEFGVSGTIGDSRFMKLAVEALERKFA
jgi:hypothetical protein